MTMTEQTPTQQIHQQHEQFMINNYNRFPLAFVRGQGCELFDADGQRYLDLFTGFGGTILGHCHPDLIKAVAEQAQTLWHVGNQYFTEPQNGAAEAIARNGFDGKCFFCHSGADANEAAIKLARLVGRARPGKVTHRYGIITAHQSFHGRSLGTIAATGQPAVREGFDPIIEGFDHVPFNDLKAMERAIQPQTIAIMVEPIQGEGGMVFPTPDYLPGLRRLCNEHDLLLILDEVWTGCGRTGRYFAHQHWLGEGQEPDIMTLAKGIGGGLAVAAICAKAHVAEHFDWRKHGRSVHATTLGANCLAMAVTRALFRVLERDGLVEKAQEMGQYVMDRLNHFASQHPWVKNVRGKGLFIALEVDPTVQDAPFERGSEIVARCMQHRVLINVTQENVLRLAPALVVNESLLDEGLNVVEQTLA